MWSFDAVQRLAEAQVAAHLFCDKDQEELRAELDVKRFVRPGPIWWAIDWASAAQQLGPGHAPPDKPKGWRTTRGVVILIDEIDKADSDVPNGLLEALGMRQFTPQGHDAPIKMKRNVAKPLIIVTTNEERMLPDAFMRRCFVLHLRLPDCVKDDRGESVDNDAREKFLQHLVERGQAHFSDALGEPHLRQAAELLFDDRQRAILENQNPRPGLAEYLDLLRAAVNLSGQAKDRDEEIKTLFEKISRFVFKKSLDSDLR